MHASRQPKHSGGVIREGKGTRQCDNTGPQGLLPEQCHKTWKTGRYLLVTTRVLSEDRLKRLKEPLDSLEGKCSKTLALSNRPDVRVVDHGNIQGALTATRSSWRSSWSVPVEKEIPKTDAVPSSESNPGISTTVVDVSVRHQHHLDPRSPVRILSMKVFNPNVSLTETGRHSRGTGEDVRDNENQGAWTDQARELTVCETSMVKSREEITEGVSGLILETVLQLNTMITENRTESCAFSLLSAKIVTLPRETDVLDELSCRSLGIKDQITDERKKWMVKKN